MFTEAPSSSGMEPGGFEKLPRFKSNKPNKQQSPAKSPLEQERLCEREMGRKKTQETRKENKNQMIEGVGDFLGSRGHASLMCSETCGAQKIDHSGRGNLE